MEKTVNIKSISMVPPSLLNETEEEFNASLEEAYQQSLRGEGITKEELKAEFKRKYGFDL